MAICYDSKHALKIAAGEYKAKDNRYLASGTEQIMHEINEHRHIRLEHVKGHSNNTGNDKADELANKGAKGKTGNS